MAGYPVRNDKDMRKRKVMIGGVFFKLFISKHTQSRPLVFRCYSFCFSLEWNLYIYIFSTGKGTYMLFTVTNLYKLDTLILKHLKNLGDLAFRW